jgi:DNA-binding IclR family transcriptional regulator
VTAAVPVEPQPEYAAPAVDKALDILELLAESTGGLSQLDIAKAVDRSPGQIFRVLMRLEKRGYVHRDPQGAYQLSMRLFDLAHRHEPVRLLVSAALPRMRALAASVRQSCNLGVLEGDRVRIVAQVESPADFGFRVRVGALFPATETATGRLLAAYEPDAPDADAAIRGEGRLIRPDAAQPGITDIVVPILRGDGSAAVAALTVPYISTSFSGVRAEDVAAAASGTAEEIRAALGV